MKIAIDISPLSSGHKVRGVGFYLENLKKSLIKEYPDEEFHFFTTGDKIPSDTSLVHFPYFEPFFLALPLYKRFKTVVTVHDLTPIVFPDSFPRGIKGEIKWQMQKFSLKQANRIITDSNNSKKDIEKLIGVKPEKIDVVYLAAGEDFKKLNDDEWKNGVSKKFNLPDKFVLYVGDVTWNKNLPRLIDAINLLNIPLVMIGKNLVSENYDKLNPWNKDLNRVWDQSRENKNIIRLGFVENEDLVKIYNLATVFVMPSLYEGFGLPILEAMASGCPVVTTKEGSLPEVAGYNSAYFVDGYNMNAIAAGIKEVFDHKDVQQDLIRKGFENIKKFSWENTAKKTFDVYKKVLS